MHRRFGSSLSVAFGIFMVLHPQEVRAQSCMWCAEQVDAYGSLQHTFLAGSDQLCDDEAEENEDCAACGWESECHTSEQPDGWQGGGCHEGCIQSLAVMASIEEWLSSRPWEGVAARAVFAALSKRAALRFDPARGVLQLRNCDRTGVIAQWFVPPNKRWYLRRVL
ncbi:MAG: hypothetical protein ACREL7_16050 [Longimicrobiales bacterium]